MSWPFIDLVLCILVWKQALPPLLSGRCFHSTGNRPPYTPALNGMCSLYNLFKESRTETELGLIAPLWLVEYACVTWCGMVRTVFSSEKFEKLSVLSFVFSWQDGTTSFLMSCLWRLSAYLKKMRMKKIQPRPMISPKAKQSLKLCAEKEFDAGEGWASDNATRRLIPRR